jgi:uncharacterized protein (UPF0297 family)
MFKEYLKEKRIGLLENDMGEFNNLMFKFSTSDVIDETLKYYLKDKGIDTRKVHQILQDISLTYDDSTLNDHEDILDSGYVLGYIQAKHGGKVIGVIFDKKTYFFIGLEQEIVKVLRQELNKELLAK